MSILKKGKISGNLKILVRLTLVVGGYYPQNWQQIAAITFLKSSKEIQIESLNSQRKEHTGDKASDHPHSSIVRLAFGQRSRCLSSDAAPR